MVFFEQYDMQLTDDTHAYIHNRLTQTLTLGRVLLAIANFRIFSK